jgi:hypothetical protein
MGQQPLPLGKNPNVRDSQNDFFFHRTSYQ